MSTIILPDRWKRQPTGPVEIARGNSLASGLKNAFGAGGQFAFDAATNKLLPISAAFGTISSVSTPYGIALSTPNGAGAKIDVAEDWRGASTVLALANISSVDSGWGGFWYKGTASNTARQLGIGRFSNTDNWYLSSHSSEAKQATSTSISGSFGKFVTRVITLASSSGSALVNFYEAGRLIEATTTELSAQTAGAGHLFLGMSPDYNATYDSGVEWLQFLRWDRVLSAAEIAELEKNPWQVFKKSARILYFPSAGGGGATGTLAATESGSDTASIAGDVLVQGALASTESGSDTAALTGDVLVQGALAATESGGDTAALTGTASVTRTGSLAATESGSDTAAATGLVLVQGSLAAAESGADTAAFTGDASTASIGSLAATESGADTAAIVGLVLIRGGLAATESGGDSASVAGLVLVRGSLAASETGSDTAAISGTSAIIGAGALAAVESGSDTAAINGVVRVSGSTAATEAGSDTAELAGVVPIRGALAATESGSDTADISSFRPTVPGIEYTLPDGRAHYTLPDGRAHFTIAA